MQKHIDELLEIAEDRIELHATGPGPHFPGWMLYLEQGLDRFPDRGWPLYRTALRSPVKMERRFGIRQLNGMEPERWPREAERMLSAIAHADPDDETRRWAVESLEEHDRTTRPS